MALSSMKNTDPVKKLNPQIQEKIDYIASPLYKKRLIELGEPKNTVDKLIAGRIDQLKNTKIEYNADLPDSALAITEPTSTYPIIKMRTPSNPKYLSGSALAHEIGHVTSSIYDEPGQMGEKNYKPIFNEDGLDVYKSKKLLNSLISSGKPTSISHKEKLFFDLQNKSANFVALPGSRINRVTGGTSLNDYFYNKRGSSNQSKDIFPFGTNVDLSEKKKPSIYANFKDPNNPINNRSAPSLDVINKPEYNEAFLSEPRNINLYNQGIPQSLMNYTGNPFARGFTSHNYSVFENKADLDAVRYLLKKYNYTKSYGDNITPELWQKALKDKRINSDNQLIRMKENFDDEAIINLNNRVAYNDSPLNVMRKNNNV